MGEHVNRGNYNTGVSANTGCFNKGEYNTGKNTLTTSSEISYHQEQLRYKTKEKTRILSLVIGIVSGSLIAYLYLGHLSSKSSKELLQGPQSSNPRLMRR